MSEAILHLVPEGSEPVDPDAALEAGDAARRAGRLDDARRAYTRALEAYRDIWDAMGEATALDSLGRLQLASGHAEAAVDAFGEAVGIWRAAGDCRQLGDALGSLGSAFHQRRDLGAARRAYAEAVTLLATCTDPHLLALTLVHAAQVEEDDGRASAARRLLGRALRQFRSCEDERGAAGALASIGLLHANCGHRRRARHAYRRALAICRDLGDETAVEWVSSQLSTVEPVADVGGVVESAALTGGAQGHGASTTRVLVAGATALGEGELDEARRLAEQTAEEARRLDRHLLEAEALVLLGQVDVEEGAATAARTVLEEARSLAGAEISPVLATRITASLARCALLDADLDGARRHCQAAFELGGGGAQLAAALLELGDAEVQGGDALRARECWRRALREAVASDSPATAANCRTRLGDAVATSPRHRGSLHRMALRVARRR